MAEVRSQNSYPNLNPNGSVNGSVNGTVNSSANGNAQSLGDSVIGSTSSAYNSVANSTTVQNLSQGPAAQKTKEELNKTSNQFSNVANSRVVPSQTAATGQPLTHYHSMFYNILSWENPRVTGIVFASIITFIFFTRYVPALKYFFKATYTILGVIAAAEVAGKLVFERGFASQMRPRKYYTIPRQSLEAALEDVEQLINFFVIEVQRIVFAENVYATVAAFASALVAYFLVKFVPTWGLGLIATTTTFFLPLVYIQNRELIDGHLNNAGTIINQQATQVRDLAAQHTGRAGEVAKSTVSQYSAKAQDLIGQAKSKAGVGAQPSTTGINGSASSQPATTSQPGTTSPLGTTSQPAGASVRNEDFPTAPTSVPASTNAGPSERAPEPLAAY